MMKRPKDDPRDGDIDTVRLVTSLVIHRDIGDDDDDDMVRCLVMKTVTMHGGNVPDVCHDCQNSSQSPGTSPQCLCPAFPQYYKLQNGQV